MLSDRNMSTFPQRRESKMHSLHTASAEHQRPYSRLHKETHRPPGARSMLGLVRANIISV